MLGINGGMRWCRETGRVESWRVMVGWKIGKMGSCREVSSRDVRGSEGGNGGSYVSQ